MILVTGATGFVGGHLVARLQKGGSAPVRILVRDRSRAAGAAGVEVVEGDLTVPASLGPALEGVDVVFHAAAITADRKQASPGAYGRVNHAGTENLVEAARKAGSGRLVVMSGLGTQPAPEGTYMATRWAMEEAVRGSGIPYVILRPSVLFGDRAPFIAALARLARRFPVLPVLGSNPEFQPLWVEDLVSCLVGCLDAPSVLGREIPLGGPERLTFREILETISSVLGVRRLLVPVPLAVARGQAGLMTALLPRPPLTPAALELFKVENTTSLDAVEREFGFAPRAFRTHLRDHGLEG